MWLLLLDYLIFEAETLYINPHLFKRVFNSDHTPKAVWYHSKSMMTNYTLYNNNWLNQILCDEFCFDLWILGYQ